jgi:Winged helix DNA-binding domain
VTRSLTGRQVLGLRTRAQQLDRTAGTVDDTAVLDVGVQDTGPDGGRWALAIRGLRDVGDEDLVLAWTVRGAPHFYRRADLPAVVTATAPFSDADAGKRIFDAVKPLKAAGIAPLAALDEVADAMRTIVTDPTVKGEVSSALATRMPEPYLRFCRGCDATHLYEMPFRLAALRAGLELVPGTTPPVLRPVPGLAPAGTVPDRLDVVRGYLRLLGPATPKHVAGYLDAPVADVRARWPEDAVEVTVNGERRWLLPDDGASDADPPRVLRLLGPYDLFLQARDRELLTDDAARAKALWPVLGRPGAVLVDGAVAGTWRARKAGRRTNVAVTAWRRIARGRLAEQAELLAAFRNTELGALDIDG